MLVETVRNVLRQNPTTFAWFARRNESDRFDRRVLRPTDDLLIDGFPRSGNTFATMAFRMAQDRPLNIGNHFHAAGQVALARRFGLPALVLFREPKEATLSYVVYSQGRITPKIALTRYIAFYKPVLQHPDSFVGADFQEVISDFGAAIDRLNTRFGTAFQRYENTPENDRATKDAIEEKRQKRIGSADENTASLARQTTPSAHKDALKNQYLSGFETPRCQTLLAQAQVLYQKMSAL